MSFIGVIVLVVLAVLFSSLRIMREYERAVVFLLGRFWKVKGPGLIIVVPIIQSAVRVELRTVVMDVPTQDVISRDNVSVKVNAVVYFRVIDPQKAVIQVEDYFAATSQLAQTTLRSVLGKHELDEMLSERDKLNADIQKILDAQTDAWGIKVSLLVLWPGLSWPGYLLLGWKQHPPLMYLDASGALLVLLEIALLIFLPYLAAALWPALKAATADPQDFLERDFI